MSARTLLLTSLLLAAASSPALAQPSATQPAPQTHSWDDVSHMNGQLVPVGETNSYLKKYRRTNISTNPVGWIFGFYGVSASYGINNHVAIRGDVNVYNLIESDDTGTEIGVGVPLYLRRTYQGAFVEPGFVVRTWSSNYCDGGGYAGCDDTSTTAGPQMLFGWHWTWDSGFNVAAAVGAGRNLAGDDEYDYDDEELFFNGYFRVGYAF